MENVKSVELTDELNWGSEATIECKVGYNRIPNITKSVCTALTSIWEPAFPQCTGK